MKLGNYDIVKSCDGAICTGILANDKNHYTYTYEGEVLTISDAYANILVLAGVIGYTFLFAVKYLKREFTIIFLMQLGIRL